MLFFAVWFVDEIIYHIQSAFFLSEWIISCVESF